MEVSEQKKDLSLGSSGTDVLLNPMSLNDCLVNLMGLSTISSIPKRTQLILTLQYFWSYVKSKPRLVFLEHFVV